MVSEKEKDNIRKYSWFEALDNAGVLQIKVLRDFLESRDLTECITCQQLLINQNKKEIDIMDEHVQACIEKNGRFMCVYFPSRGKEKIDLSKLNNKDLKVWWFNPKNGLCYSQDNKVTTEANYIDVAINEENNRIVEIQTPTEGKEKD